MDPYCQPFKIQIWSYVEIQNGGQNIKILLWLINVFLDPKHVGVDTTPELISLFVSEILRKIRSKWRPFWNPRWRPKYQHFTLTNVFLDTKKCGCRHHFWVDIFIDKRDIRQNRSKMATVVKSNMAAIQVSWKFGNSNFLGLYSI